MKLSNTRLDIALEKYNEIRQGLADTQAKAETLCVCWDKLDQDMTELTEVNILTEREPFNFDLILRLSPTAGAARSPWTDSSRASTL